MRKLITIEAYVMSANARHCKDLGNEFNFERFNVYMVFWIVRSWSRDIDGLFTYIQVS
jgi:hypothetical protein